MGSGVGEVVRVEVQTVDQVDQSAVRAALRGIQIARRVERAQLVELALKLVIALGGHIASRRDILEVVARERVGHQPVYRVRAARIPRHRRIHRHVAVIQLNHKGVHRDKEHNHQERHNKAERTRPLCSLHNFPSRESIFSFLYYGAHSPPFQPFARKLHSFAQFRARKSPPQRKRKAFMSLRQHHTIKAAALCANRSCPIMRYCPRFFSPAASLSGIR